jgi:hypothetical protein
LSHCSRKFPGAGRNDGGVEVENIRNLQHK